MPMMERRRPRVSHETRQLLGIVAVSVAVLWGLARLRYSHEAPTPNPVPPVLAQLVPASPFDTIAASVADVMPQVEPLVMPLTFRDLATGATRVRAGLGFREGLALTIAPGRESLQPSEGADALAETEAPAPGDLGVEVQALSPALQSAIGTAASIAVTWVDADGPAAGQLAAADVLQEIDDQPLMSLDDWRARVERLGAGDSVRVRLQRNGEAIEVTLTARQRVPEPAPQPLGLVLRTKPRIGAEVTAVEAGS